MKMTDRDPDCRLGLGFFPRGVGTAIAVIIETDTEEQSNPGAHGLQPIALRVYRGNNNGRALPGLSANNFRLPIHQISWRFVIAVPHASAW